MFGGATLTASDVAVASKVAHMGEPWRVAHLEQDVVMAAMAVIRQKVEDTIDQVKVHLNCILLFCSNGNSAYDFTVFGCFAL